MRKVLILVTFIFSVFLLSGCGPKKPAVNTPVAEPTPMPTKPIEQSIKERPYVSLLPTQDRHWVTLEIKNIPKATKGINYDLIYLADFEGSKIERGISTGGVPVELNGSSDYSKKVLFGSASCTTGTCKYKYDENVTEGSLSFNFDKGEKYETPYRIQKGKEALTEGFTTGDRVFSLKATLPANSIYITTSSIGLPVPLPSGVTAKSIPYAVFPSITTKVSVSFKSSLEGVSIYAYNGKTWQKLATTTAGGELKADTTGSSLFILAQ